MQSLTEVQYRQLIKYLYEMPHFERIETEHLEFMFDGNEKELNMRENYVLTVLAKYKNLTRFSEN